MTAMESRAGLQRIGWIGTGVMGANLCQHLLRAGYQLIVFSRTKGKADSLMADGARWANDPKSVAEQSDVVFSMVGFPDDVRQVHLGARGTLAGCRPGTMLVDMTTSSPQLAAEIYQAAFARGVSSLDAPVSGGEIGARNATLSIMIGGDRETAERLRQLWNCMGKTIVYQGPAGSGQHAKLTNQILIATNMIGVCEALLYAYRVGLDLQQVMTSVSPGAAGSWSLSHLGPRIIADDFEPGFYVEHFLKDLRIALQESHRRGLNLPGLHLAQQLYETVVEQGYARRGTQSLHLALARQSGIEWLQRKRAHDDPQKIPQGEVK